MLRRSTPKNCGAASLFLSSGGKSFYFLCKRDKASRCCVCLPPKLRERECSSRMGGLRRSAQTALAWKRRWRKRGIKTPRRRPYVEVCVFSVVLGFSVALRVAAEAGVPGPTAGRAGLLAGQAQRDAAAVHCLQVARAGCWRLQGRLFVLAARGKDRRNT